MKCAAAAALAALAACGGGGSNEGDSDSGSNETLAVSFALDANELSETLAAGDEVALQLSGRWSATGTAPAAVFLQLQDAASTFVATDSVQSTGTVALNAAVRDGLPAGLYESQLRLQACLDAKCAQPLPGAVTLPYKITVQPVDDWVTHQGSNAHRGSVPVRLDPSKFKQVWTWNRPAGSEPIGGINPVVTHQGKVFLTTDVYNGQAALYALDEQDGHELWVRSLGSVPALNPPAVAGGRVFASVTGHGDTFLYAFDLQTGAYLHKSPFGAQWPNFLAPTVSGDLVFQGGGGYGGIVYAFSTSNGNEAWTADVGGVWDMYSVAADEQWIYHHNGAALHVLSQADGSSIANIADPFGSSSGLSYHGGPLIGTKGMVMSFAGNAFSGRASASTEHGDPRVISSFNVEQQAHVWSSNHAYITTPATADGIVYAARNQPAVLDVIDELTGQVLWSFQLPSAHGVRFHRNIVVTRGLLFVSTDTRVLAIDLKSRAIVWSQATPGMLALSADRTLYIATGAIESDGRLIAVRLK